MLIWKIEGDTSTATGSVPGFSYRIMIETGEGSDVRVKGRRDASSFEVHTKRVRTLLEVRRDAVGLHGRFPLCNRTNRATYSFRTVSSTDRTTYGRRYVRYVRYLCGRSERSRAGLVQC